MPSLSERQQIFEVILKRYGRESSKFNVKKLADKSPGFTGAEIEQAIISAMYNRFGGDGKEFTSIDIEDELLVTRPLSVTSKEEIEKMRAGAVDRLRAVSSSGATKMSTMSEGTSRAATEEEARVLDDLS